jgi:DNA gyrase subunit A
MPESGRLIPVAIEDEMKSSYLDYAMSVIISRALPDVRDGLKPVHRRVIYGMHSLGLPYNKPFKKSARIVGEVMGKYHPHGDSAIYDTLVRMAQNFSLRYTLVDGQGNFGSIDGDNPAAMRYTESRLSRIAGEMVLDLDKETVDFRPNFDDTESEPSVLPSSFPNLLVNGSTGIAVGMATNIPPHNLREICGAIIATLEKPDIDIAELMTYVQGPDFPTGGIIQGRQGIYDYLNTGRGRLVVRAKANIETLENNRKNIIITEIPYQVNKSALLQKIAELVREKRIEGISAIRDESDREGMRVVLEIKRDAFPEIILNLLYKNTQMQATFGVIFLVLVKNRPKVLNLKEAILGYVGHRHEVVVRRTQFDLDKAEKRAHILEGLKIALDNIDAVIATIKKSKDTPDAQKNLMEKFGLSALQADAILEMRLQRLTGLERDKIENEYLETIKLIAELKFILESKDKRMQIIRDELAVIRDRYGDDRRTQIIDDENVLTIEDMIADEDNVITITQSGYIKRQPVNVYRSQGRGGRGVQGMTTKEEDFVKHLFIASTHSFILFFTNLGRCYWLRVLQIPAGGRQSSGKAVVNLLQLKPEEKINAYVPVKSFEDEFAQKSYIVMASRNGVINKMNLTAFSNIRKDGVNAITLDEGDGLIEARLTQGTNEIILGTAHGLAIRFPESAFREMGRGTRGVRGIKLESGDYVAEMVVVRAGASLLTVTQHGYGKRSQVADYRVTNRGGKGVINIKASDRNGRVVALKEVIDDDELMIISRQGVIIRIAARDVSIIGRATQGVRLIRLDENDEVIDVAKVIKSETNGTDTAPAEIRPLPGTETLTEGDRAPEEISEPEEPTGDEPEEPGDSDDPPTER